MKAMCGHSDKQQLVNTGRWSFRSQTCTPESQVSGAQLPPSTTDDVNLSPIVKTALKRQPGRVRMAALRHSARNGTIGRASTTYDPTPIGKLPRQLLDRTLPPLPGFPTNVPSFALKRKAIPGVQHDPSPRACSERHSAETSFTCEGQKMAGSPTTPALLDLTQSAGPASPQQKQHLPTPPSSRQATGEIAVDSHSRPSQTDCTSSSVLATRARQIAGPKVKEAVQKIEGRQVRKDR